MPGHIFVLLVSIVRAGEAIRFALMNEGSLIVHAEEAVGIKAKTSSGQRATRKTVREETWVTRAVGAARAKAKTNRGQHATQKKVWEEILVAHVDEAVRVNTKTRLGQHAATRNVSEEILDAHTGELIHIKVKASPGQHAAQKKASSSSQLFFILIPASLVIFYCGWVARAYGSILLNLFNPSRRSSEDTSRLRKGLAVQDDDGTETAGLEWCQPDAVLFGACKSDVDMITPSWNAKSLREVLRIHASKMVDGWKPEHLAGFADELSEGRARLAREANSLVRVVDLLVVLVIDDRHGLVLQGLGDGSLKLFAAGETDIKECTLKTRFRSDEGFMECAERCLRKLGAGMDKLIKIVPDILGMREERRILHSAHPGLPTLMQYYVVEAKVVATDRCDLERLGLLSKTLHVADCVYQWDHLESLPYVNRHLKQSWGASRQGAATWIGISHSLVPVLPWTEKAVIEKLEERGFRGRGAVPLNAMKHDLLGALQEGRVSLAVRKTSPPKLAFVEERVSVVVTSAHTGMIQQSGVSEEGFPILPSVQRYASESCWRAAVRLSQTTLRLSAPLFQMEGQFFAVSDKIQNQKMWDVITREHVLRGPWIDGHFARC